jgi:hypothetical protein
MARPELEMVAAALFIAAKGVLSAVEAAPPEE